MVRKFALWYAPPGTIGVCGQGGTLKPWSGTAMALPGLLGENTQNVQRFSVLSWERRVGCGAVFLALAAGPVLAQVQVGTGANGGLCFGVNCYPGTPPNVGTGANGGLCFGPYCGPPADSEPEHSPYQSHSSVEPFQPSPSQSAKQDFPASPTLG